MIIVSFSTKFGWLWVNVMDMKTGGVYPRNSKSGKGKVWPKGMLSRDLDVKADK